MNRKGNPSLWSLTLKLVHTKPGNFPYIQHILCSTCFTPLLEGRGRGESLLWCSINGRFERSNAHGYSTLPPASARGSVQTTTRRSGFQTPGGWFAQLWNLDSGLELLGSLPHEKLGMFRSRDMVQTSFLLWLRLLPNEIRKIQMF